MKPRNPPAWPIGSLSPSKPGTHFQMPSLNFAEPTRVCNSMVREPLSMAAIWTSPQRPGSEVRHPSHGQRC